MNLDNTSEELKAIKSLERAFKNCSKLGIRFTVMDYDLMWNNPRLYKETSKIAKENVLSDSGSYPPIAYSQDIDNEINVHVNTHETMDSCGGW